MASETSADTGPIVADIARTRADLGATIEALADRVAPKKVIARAKAQLAFKKEELKDRFHPVRVVQRKLGRPRRAIGGPRPGVLTVRAASAGRDGQPALDPGPDSGRAT